MAIHVTRRELKIKIRLFVALSIILGFTTILYLIFCQGKGYNEVKIDLPVQEATTELVTEQYIEDVTEPTSIDENESETESETEPESHISWDNYDPIEVLGGENWSLALINSAHPIGKGYKPLNTSPLTSDSSIEADSRVSEAYQKMYDAAKAEGIILTPYAGYVSYSRQQEIYNTKVNALVTQGKTEEEARAIVNERTDTPGASESGAGLSVDIIGTSSEFNKTKEYEWLMKNAHKYGFVLRYPDEKFSVTGVKARPWHWRYVGVDAATEMKNQNLCIEEYLEKNM